MHAGQPGFVAIRRAGLVASSLFHIRLDGGSLCWDRAGGPVQHQLVAIDVVASRCPPVSLTWIFLYRSYRAPFRPRKQ